MPAPSKTHSEASGTAAQTRVLTADTPWKSESGATFEAPKGWSLTTRGHDIVLAAPENDLSVTLIEIENEPDAQLAITKAWARSKPGFALAKKSATTPPARDGWDAVTQIVYEAPGAEQRSVIALAQRKGTTQYVALLEGANAGFDRRGAQLGTIIETFRAPGVQEESLAGRTAHAFDAERSQRWEQFLRDGMDKTKVPGLAVVVLQGGKIVYEKGLGVRALGSKAAVTPSTLFAIGSTSKSLTTLMMAKLVDEQKFAWSTPAVEVLPSFALGDAAATKQLTMKHTVCACAGMPRQDMEWIFEYANVTPEQNVASLAGMKPTTGFGETFQYSNTLVSSGGYLAAHAALPTAKLGPAYDRTMQSRIFGPLGMHDTTFDPLRVKAREHASPHGENLQLDRLVMPVSVEGPLVPVRPAGGAWSNVRDMAKYVALELAKGKDPTGRVLVSETNLLERRKPQVKMGETQSYGLGLFVETDHGIPIVHHGGNTLGFTSDLYFLPEHGIGVVLLMNAGGANALRVTARRRLLELLFDGKEEAATRLDFAVRRNRDAAAQELAKITMAPEPEWSNEFIATYTHTTLGKIVVRSEGKRLVLDAGEWRSDVGRKKEDDGTLALVLLDPPFEGLALRVGPNRSLVLDAGQAQYVLERAAQP